PNQDFLYGGIAVFTQNRLGDGGLGRESGQNGGRAAERGGRGEKKGQRQYDRDVLRQLVQGKISFRE
ncbi:MAG: hypothetical protein LBD58_06225, partial [Treponema sp.]|nr:hypothetical protein [Treponema sp.]